MVFVLGILNTTILFFLAIIHIYWGLGGRKGFARAYPTTNEGKRVLNPKPVSCYLVSIVLMVAAVFTGLESQIFTMPVNRNIVHYGVLTMSVIFILRAIGDFKYVGFSKSIKNTEFGRLDSYYYSPLVLAIGLIGLYISLM